MKHARIVMLVAFGLSLVLVTPTIAYVKLPYKWNSNSVSYDKHTLNSSWVSRAQNGAVQWNNVTPSPFGWSASSAGDNDIYLAGIDGRNGVLASTTIWSSGSRITKINIKFDTGETWYLGTGSPGSSSLDAWSIAAHEFGHASGLNHTQWNHCLPGWPATMCPTYSYGNTHARSLENDDRSGLNSIYP